LDEVNFRVAGHVELVTRALLGNVSDRCNGDSDSPCGGVVSGDELPSSTVRTLGDLASIAVSVDLVASSESNDVPLSENASDGRQVFSNFSNGSLSVTIRHCSLKGNLLEIAL
jgi:hypothetical protein